MSSVYRIPISCTPAAGRYSVIRLGFRDRFRDAHANILLPYPWAESAAEKCIAYSVQQSPRNINTCYIPRSAMARAAHRYGN
jgi:hypothetical protein